MAIGGSILLRTIRLAFSLTVQTVARLIRHGSDCTALHRHSFVRRSNPPPDYAIAAFFSAASTSSLPLGTPGTSPRRALLQVGQVGDRSASFGSNLATSNCQYDLANTKDIYTPQWTPACFTRGIHQPDHHASHPHADQSRIDLPSSIFSSLELMAKRYHLARTPPASKSAGNFATPINSPTPS